MGSVDEKDCRAVMMWSDTYSVHTVQSLRLAWPEATETAGGKVLEGGSCVVHHTLSSEAKTCLIDSDKLIETPYRL